jgi:hypothetical protein
MISKDALLMVHPDASVVMGDGRVLIALHNAEGDITSVESEKPELAAVVMAFSRPLSLASVADRFTYFPPDTLKSAIDLLLVSGVLVEASDLITDDGSEYEMMLASARAVAKSAVRVEEELKALGPSSNVVRLRRRLRSVEAQTKLVASEIGVRRSMAPPRHIEREK